MKKNKDNRKSHHWNTKSVYEEVTAKGNIHKWMLKLVSKNLRRNNMFLLSKYLPQDIFNNKGKNSNITVQKSGKQYLIQVTKVNITKNKMY